MSAMGPSTTRVQLLRRSNSLVQLPARQLGIRKIRPQRTTLLDHASADPESPGGRRVTSTPPPSPTVPPKRAAAAAARAGRNTGWNPTKFHNNRKPPDHDKLLGKHLSAWGGGGPWGHGAGGTGSGVFEDGSLESRLEAGFGAVSVADDRSSVSTTTPTHRSMARSATQPHLRRGASRRSRPRGRSRKPCGWDDCPGCELCLPRSPMARSRAASHSTLGPASLASRRDLLHATPSVIDLKVLADEDEIPTTLRGLPRVQTAPPRPRGATAQTMAGGSLWAASRPRPRKAHLSPVEHSRLAEESASKVRRLQRYRRKVAREEGRKSRQRYVRSSMSPMVDDNDIRQPRRVLTRREPSPKSHKHLQLGDAADIPAPAVPEKKTHGLEEFVYWEDPPLEPLLLMPNRMRVSRMRLATRPDLTNSGKSPLHLAALLGREDLVKRFLAATQAKGLSIVNDTDAAGNTPMHLIASTTHSTREEIVATLRRHGADMDILNSYGWQAIHYAAAAGDMAMIKCLTSNGANINARTSHRVTPLALCCTSGNNQAVRLLVTLGANVFAEDEHMRTVVYYAAASSHGDTADLIQQAQQKYLANRKKMRAMKTMLKDLQAMGLRPKDARVVHPSTRMIKHEWSQSLGTRSYIDAKVSEEDEEWEAPTEPPMATPAPRDHSARVPWERTTSPVPSSVFLGGKEQLAGAMKAVGHVSTEDQAAVEQLARELDLSPA